MKDGGLFPFIERVIRRLKIMLFGWPFVEDKPRTIIESLSPSDVLIDVGANVGMYASFAPCRVYAFEPAERAYMSLKANLEGSPRYSFYNFAVSDTDGHKTLYIQPWSGHNSFTHLSNTVDEEKVKCITLDSFVAEHGIVPTFIKVDVEGHELEVLRGALGTLKKHHPRLLVETTPGRAEEILAPLGYTGERIDKSNYLFTP